MPNLRRGTEKTIHWFGGRTERTPLSVVYLHGYSASRQEIAPLPLRVAKSLGANLFSTRLRGHGRNADAMLEASADALLQDAREALLIGERIGERVVLLSTSTGGTLSTWLAAHAADRIEAVVMLSPNFGPRNGKLYLLDWPVLGPLLVNYVLDEYRSWQPHNEQQAQYWTWYYPYRSLLGLVRLMKRVEAIDKATITTPALVIYSPADQVIDPEAVIAGFNQWGSPDKRLIAYPNSTDPAQHVLAGDILSPGSTDELTLSIVAFLHRHGVGPETR